MGFWDFLSGISPGGAAASVATAVSDSVFGGIDKIIRDFKLPPEAMVEYEKFKAEQLGKLQMIAAADTASARQMESITKSRMPALLTMFYSFSFIGLSIGIVWMSFALPDLTISSFQASMIGAIWGALANQAALGSSFYLGSSSASADKNNTIDKMANAIQLTGRDIPSSPAPVTQNINVGKS